MELSVTTLLKVDAGVPSPVAGQMLVGGAFLQAGDRWVQNVAGWDGSGWHALGPGPGVQVEALALYDGTVVAAGRGGSGRSVMQVWNGVSWQSPSGGLPSGEVYALLEFNGRLVVGGAFQSAGGVSEPGIAQWDGTGWHPMGGGLGPEPPALGVSVTALEEFDGRLIAAGSFDRAGGAGGARCRSIAAWNGVRWEPLGDRGVDRYLALAVHEGALVALAASGNVREAMLWVGRGWERLGGELPRSASRLDSTGGELYVFAGADVLRWDGSSWRVHATVDGTAAAACWAFGRLHIAGRFETTGGVELGSIAALEGGAWRPLGGGRSRNAAVVGTWRGELVAASTLVRRASWSVNQQRIETWDGYRWREIGVVGDGSSDPGRVWEFVDLEGLLIAAGEFKLINGERFDSIAAYDRTRWRPLGAGFNGAVRALAVYRGELIAGGYFEASGTDRVWRLARWTGERWEQLGPDLDRGWFGVLDLLPLGSDLIVAGSFDLNSPGVRRAGVARWNGSAWSPMGNLWRGVTHLAEHEGRIIAARAMDTSNHRTEWSIFQWTGLGWAEMGRPRSLPTLSLHVHEGRLLWGGRLSVWNGESWQPTITPELGDVGPMASWSGRLAVVQIGPYDVSGLRQWASSVPAPEITSPPQPTRACHGDPASLAVRFAGVAPLTPVWLRDGTPVTISARIRPVLSPDGRASRLQFQPALSSDAGMYSVELSGPCGTVRSIEVGLSVCLADWDCDGTVSIDDLSLFAGDIASGTSRADLDGDGATDYNDFLAFLNAFAAGCP
jgi:hypothetical protein